MPTFQGLFAEINTTRDNIKHDLRGRILGVRQIKSTFFHTRKLEFVSSKFLYLYFVFCTDSYVSCGMQSLYSVWKYWPSKAKVWPALADETFRLPLSYALKPANLVLQGESTHGAGRNSCTNRDSVGTSIYEYINWCMYLGCIWVFSKDGSIQLFRVRYQYCNLHLPIPISKQCLLFLSSMPWVAVAEAIV